MSAPRPLIGFCGLAGSGKDYAGAELVTTDGFARLAFGDGLKRALYALDPIVLGANGFPVSLAETVDQIGWDQAKLRPSVRRMLQRLGTEVGREVLSPVIGADVWIEMLDHEAGLLEVLDPEQGVVVTDVRFADEAEWIRRAGGVVVKVVREPLVGDAAEHRFGMDGENAQHASEHLDFEVDLELENRRGLSPAEFRRELDDVLLAARKRAAEPR